MRLLTTVLFLAACTPDVEPAPPLEDAWEGTPTSQTVVRVGSDPVWAESPFPSETFRPEGAPMVPGGFPNVRANEALFDRIGDVLSNRTGFCTTCNIVFGFDGGLDAESLDGHIAIVDLVDGSEIATEHEWQAATGTLTVRAAKGNALLPNRTYAAVVRAGVLGSDGLLVRSPIDIDLELGDDLAAFTSFETDDPASDLRAVRRAIQLEAAPHATLGDVFVGDALQGLLGSAETNAPGVQQPAGEGGEGYAIRHTTTSVIVTGTIDAARFLDGEGADVGVLVRNGAGDPVATGREEVPFVLIVPNDADLANLPVVVMHHGFNASRVTSLTLADTAGQAGWAVLGIDAYQHGNRARSAVDGRNSMRDVDGADGFAETNKLDVVSRVFGFSGVPTEFVLSPEYALSAFTQFVADSLSTIYFVRRGDVSALRAVEGLEALRFDPERIVFVGNSMGAVVGTGVIAVESDLAGAVLNVMPGSIIETLAESGEFRPLMERVFLPLLGVDHTFDEAERAMLFDPTVDLFRWVMEPVDPLALASSRVVDNVLVQLAAHDEVAAPRPSESVATAGGFEQVSRYPDAMHGMMEVELQTSRFVAPLIPPLVRRDEPVEVGNPIDAVHDEITTFLLAVSAP